MVHHARRSCQSDSAYSVIYSHPPPVIKMQGIVVRLETHLPAYLIRFATHGPAEMQKQLRAQSQYHALDAVRDVLQEESARKRRSLCWQCYR